MISYTVGKGREPLNTLVCLPLFPIDRHNRTLWERHYGPPHSVVFAETNSRTVAWRENVIQEVISEKFERQRKKTT